MTRPACLTNKRLPKEAKDYEIRSRSREKGKAARLSLPEVVERSVAHCGTQVLRTRFSFVFRGVTGSGDYRPWCATVTRIVVSKIAATHLATWHTLVFPFSTVAGTGNTRGQLVMRVVCCVSGWEREFLFLFFSTERERDILTCYLNCDRLS